MWDIRRPLSCWVDKAANIDNSTTATFCPRTVIVDGSSSLLLKAWTFVFWQFISSLRDAASGAIVSNASISLQVAWQAERPAKSRSENKCRPNDTNSCLCQQFFTATSPRPWQTRKPRLLYGENCMILASTVFEILADWRPKIANFAWPWNPGQGSLKLIDFGTNGKRVYTFLLVINSNFSPILHYFGGIGGLKFENCQFYPPLLPHLMPPLWGTPQNFGMKLALGIGKLEGWGYCVVKISWSVLTDPPVWRTDGRTIAYTRYSITCCRA